MTEPKPSLRTTQLADMAWAMAHKRIGLLHDPGVGKTPPVCVLLYWHWTEGRRSVWVMPKQLIDKNVDELLRFSHFTPADVVVVDGSRKQVEAAIRSNAKVFLMGFDRWKLSWRQLLEAHPDIGVLAGDEWHMGYSTHDSARTQELYEAMRYIEGLIAMTGTIIKGRLTSAYPLIHLIEPRYYVGYEDFERQHEVIGPDGKRAGWTNHGKLAQIFAKHCLRRTFESEYGPEAKVIVPERVAMAPKQRAAYEEFEAKAILELENAFLTAGHGGVFALRCRQIMAHPETFGLAEGEKTGKDQLLDVHLSNHANDGTPFGIFGAFVPEQERIYELCKAKGFRVGLMNGTTKQAERNRIDIGFRKGQVDIIVGSPQVATVGYNWDHCDHVAFASTDYGDDTFYQAYRRFIRGVRTKPLLISVLEYAKSIDQRIFRIIEQKSSDANRIDGREVYRLGATSSADA